MLRGSGQTNSDLEKSTMSHVIEVLQTNMACTQWIQSSNENSIVLFNYQLKHVSNNYETGFLLGEKIEKNQIKVTTVF